MAFDLPVDLPIKEAALVAALADWVPGQRWFGGKGRSVASYEIEAASPVLDGDPALHDVLVRVNYAGEGDAAGEATEHYQLLLGSRSSADERIAHAVIAEADGLVLYDGTHDPELTGELLRLIATDADAGPLRFRRLAGDLDPEAPGRPLSGVEQSNTSVIFGDSAILKIFRKVSPGINPDLELSRALAEAGSAHIARPLGYFEADLDGEPSTLGMLQDFLRSGTDGWALATISVRDLFAEGDLHADEVGGDFAAEAERLGAATAEVHRDLAAALGSRELSGAERDAVVRALEEHLDAACSAVPELRPHRERVAEAYQRLREDDARIDVQRVHGDYHLGQVLRVDSGWVLLDFEGEPARTLAERRAPASPLRDVAGMLRSFDYAARHLLMESQYGPEQSQLAYRAIEWAERNKDAFCAGYAQQIGRDPREDAGVLRAFELDKAIYEVRYEARNRPTWLPIPLGTIERLAGNPHD